MRTDNIPNTVGQEHECRGGHALRVSAHVAAGELEREDEGGYEGADLFHLSISLIFSISWVGGKGERGDGWGRGLAHDIIPK